MEEEEEVVMEIQEDHSILRTGVTSVASEVTTLEIALDTAGVVADAGLTPDRVLTHAPDHDLAQGQGASAADPDLLRGADPAANHVTREHDLVAREGQTQKEGVLLLANPDPDLYPGPVAGRTK